MTSSTEISRYRSIMNKLVSGLVTLTEQMEGILQVPANQGESGRQVASASDWLDGFRMSCILLLRRTRLHAIAVLRANEACNAHSLGVQMRPALECIGQLALLIHNSLLDPERGRNKFLAYMDADYYGTIIRAMKGEIGHEQLLEQMEAIRRKSEEHATKVVGGDFRFVKFPRRRRNRGRKLRNIHKMTELVGGESWYRYLSEHFCHGNPAGVRETWQGGVISTNAMLDEVACAGMMDYLANQMALMIAYVAMYPTDGQVDEDHGTT